MKMIEKRKLNFNGEIINGGIEMNKDLINALTEFKQAYNSLLDEWLQDSILNETESINLYPFDKSFDELEIDEWIDNAILELNK